MESLKILKRLKETKTNNVDILRLFREIPKEVFHTVNENSVKSFTRDENSDQDFENRLKGKNPPSDLTRQDNVVKEDSIELSRVFFLLGVLERVVRYFSQQELKQEVIPLLFSGITSHNDRINKYCHVLFKQIFTIPSLDFDIQNPPVQTATVPYYVKVSLENYPAITPIEPFQESLASLLRSLSLQQYQHEVSPSVQKYQQQLGLFCIQSLHDRCKHFILIKKPKLLLCYALAFQMSYVDIQLLPRLLEKLTEIIQLAGSESSAKPSSAQKVLLKYCHDIISNNFDYSRKSLCMKWYLKQLEEQSNQL